MSVGVIYKGGMRAVDAAGFRFPAGKRVEIPAEIAKKLLDHPEFKQAPKTAATAAAKETK